MKTTINIPLHFIDFESIDVELVERFLLHRGYKFEGEARGRKYYRKEIGKWVSSPGYAEYRFVVGIDKTSKNWLEDFIFNVMQVVEDQRLTLSITGCTVDGNHIKELMIKEIEIDELILTVLIDNTTNVTATLVDRFSSFHEYLTTEKTIEDAIDESLEILEQRSSSTGYARMKIVQFVDKKTNKLIKSVEINRESN